jgi:hypothetical protein
MSCGAGSSAAVARAARVSTAHRRYLSDSRFGLLVRDKLA